MTVPSSRRAALLAIVVPLVLAAVTDPLAHRVTDASGHTSTYSWSGANRLSLVASPVGVWSHTYDALGNRRSTTHPDGQVTAFGHDPAGRVTAIDYPDAPDVAYSYAPDGFRTKMVDAGATTSFVADSLGRMTSATRGGDTFSYGWDRASQLTSLTYPDATAFSYGYDDDAHLGRVSSGGVDIATYAHDPSGRLTTTTRPNSVVTTASWDTAGRLFDIVHSTATATVARASYVLDATNNPTRITDRTGAVSTHDYDASDRLVHTCYAGTCAGATDYVDYRYDAVGNRLTQTTPDGVTAFSYGPAGQLVGEVGPGGTRAYGYDTSGNLSRAGRLYPPLQVL
ncbi:MAG TPA: hypothetical protein VM142_04395 [Acidimicrobiales bacterium]|nr:hypothetical protein [Acidimicrobiales bacterium]